SAFDDRANMRKLGEPSQFFTNLAAGGDQHRWVAIPARTNLGTDLLARFFSCGVDYFLDGETFPVAQIIKAASTVKRAERQNVRLREIHHVNIVAYTRAVPGRIVSPKNERFFAFAQCDLKHNR